MRQINASSNLHSPKFHVGILVAKNDMWMEKKSWSCDSINWINSNKYAFIYIRKCYQINQLINWIYNYMCKLVFY